MRTITYILLVAILMTGCVSSRKLMDRGDYDQAIAKAVKKLKKKPEKEKEILVLKQAFAMANQFDNERIEFLKKSGQPEIWEEVFDRFRMMKSRQNLVRTLRSDVLSKINFSAIDYDNEIINAKKKAAAYFYAHAEKLLETNFKHDAREAFDDLNKVKAYYSEYKDVDALMSKAYHLGLNNVLFLIENNARVALPEDFEDEILKVSMKDVNSKWVNYDTYPVQHTKYDYHVVLNLKSIRVSPEEVSKKEYTESVDVQDGWQYVYDDNGNVMKDSTGQDMQVPRYVRVAAYVDEIHLFKKAFVGGTMDYYNVYTEQLVKSEPISTEWIFDHLFAEVHGDRRALSPESRDLARRPAIPFPSDLEMIFSNTERLKSISKDILRRNKHLLEQ